MAALIERELGERIGGPLPNSPRLALGFGPPPPTILCIFRWVYTSMCIYVWAHFTRHYRYRYSALLKNFTLKGASYVKLTEAVIA